MPGDLGEASACELRILYADGYSAPFTVRELVATIRHRNVMALTCVFATLLALPGGGAFSAEVPLLARILLNLFSVGLFAVLFPALLKEVHEWASSRTLRVVPEPAITVPIALITTLAVEALAIFVVGENDLTRWDLALKLGFGAMFWELHITMMLRFMGPTMRARDRARQALAPPPQVAPSMLRIGNVTIEAAELRRIETDDHFLILHSPEGPRRVFASFNEIEGRLEPLGVRVHRRHWVSHAELGEIRPQGRSHMMRTRSGEDVPVARERRKAVDAIIAQRSAS